jgi:hypothetical protein
MAVIYTPHFAQFFDDNGNPLSGGKLYTYAATTTTPKATYTTEAGDIESPNPVILDSAGRATFFISGSYRFDLYDSSDVLVRSTDDVSSFTAESSAQDAYFQSFSGDGTTTAFTTSEDLGTDEKLIMVFINNGLDEFITNGAFDTDSDWTKGSGWAIGSGVATATTASTALEQDANKTIQEGQSYTVIYTITRSAGTITPSIGGTDGTTQNSAGTYTETIICGSTQALSFTGAGFSGTVDNVSVTKVSGAGFNILPTSGYTINGTTLTTSIAPASGTNNVQVWAPARLAAAASASADAASGFAAQAEAAADSVLNGTGFAFDYSTTTTEADPTAGKFRLDNTTLASATELYISYTSDASQDVENTIATWDDSDSTVRGTLRITKQGAPENYAIFQLTGTRTDNTTWAKFSITYVDSGGVWTDTDAMTVEFHRTGDKGETGAQGATGSISDFSGTPQTFPVGTDFFLFSDTSDSGASKIYEISNIDAGLFGAGVAANGTVLTSNGSGDANWVAPSGSDGRVLIKEGTVTSAADLTLVNGVSSAVFDSTYDIYELEIINAVPVTDGADLYLRVSDDTGVTFEAGASDYSWIYQGSSAFADANDAQIRIGDTCGNDTGEACTAKIRIYTPSNSTYTKKFEVFLAGNFTSGLLYIYQGGAEFKGNTNAIDALQVLFSSGNISTLSYKLYGIS